MGSGRKGEAGGFRERREGGVWEDEGMEKTEEEEVEGRWNRPIWLGQTANSEGSPSRGIE